LRLFGLMDFIPNMSVNKLVFAIPTNAQYICTELVGSSTKSLFFWVYRWLIASFWQSIIRTTAWKVIFTFDVYYQVLAGHKFNLEIQSAFSSWHQKVLSAGQISIDIAGSLSQCFARNCKRFDDLRGVWFLGLFNVLLIFLEFSIDELFLLYSMSFWFFY